MGRQNSGVACRILLPYFVNSSKVQNNLEVGVAHLTASRFGFKPDNDAVQTGYHEG